MPVINVEGLRVSYSDTGNGVAVVFVPGLGGAKEWFCYQASGLADHFRVISYDLRRARGRACYSLGLLADDLARFLRAIHVHSAVIVGHSFGGLIALQFAVSHPQSCLVLALASTTPSYPDLPEEALVSHLLPGEISHEGFLVRLWRKLRGDGPRMDDDSEPLGYLARFTRDLDYPTITERIRVMRESDMTPALGEIAAPTLVLAGSLEQSYVLAGAQLMDEQIPHATLEVIENTDQYCFYTRHDLFNAVLADYLSQEVARL